jgi:hypothetical protein
MLKTTFNTFVREFRISAAGFRRKLRFVKMWISVKFFGNPNQISEWGTEDPSA